MYGGVIWTNHAMERLSQRGISQQMGHAAFVGADRQFAGKERDTTVFQKQFGELRVTLIGKQNEKKEWIVISAWVDPPLYGTADYRKKQEFGKYKKAGGFKKFLLIVRQQIGI